MSPGISAWSVFLPLITGEKRSDVSQCSTLNINISLSVSGSHQQLFMSGYWVSHQTTKVHWSDLLTFHFPGLLKMLPLLSLQAPVRCQVPTITLIDIGNDPIRRLNHLHRSLSKEFALIVYKLAPEPTIGPNDRPSGLYPGVCLS